MKHLSGVWVAAGLLGMGLLWTGLRKTEQEPAQPTRLRERDRSAAAIVVAAAEQVTSGVNRSKPESKSIRFQQPDVAARWRELDEDELMRSLTELSAEDAELALQLAREANTRFPNSPRAVERDYLEVRALVNAGRLDEAVAQARALVAANPDHALANDVARHLLTHPMHHPTEISSR